MRFLFLNLSLSAKKYKKVVRDFYFEKKKKHHSSLFIRTTYELILKTILTMYNVLINDDKLQNFNFSNLNIEFGNFMDWSFRTEMTNFFLGK